MTVSSNVILVRPPDPMGNVEVLSHVQPTNLGYLAAVIERAGMSVDIWDYETEPFSAVGFLTRLRDTAPRVLGLTAMTPTIINAHNIAALAKKHFPDLVTVIGGVHSTSLPRQTMEEFPAFDLIATHEGEETFTEICRTVLDGGKPQGLRGTWWRDGERIVEEPKRGVIADLDALPFPARHLYIDTQRDRKGHHSRGVPNSFRSVDILVSRGCPFGCTFCSTERKVRWRSPENIYTEIMEVKERWGLDHLGVASDTFSLKRDWALAVCEVFARAGIKSWDTNTRVDRVDLELLQKMAASGCTKLAFGVESGSERISSLNGKKIRMDQVERSVRMAHEAGIKNIEGNFIIGSHPDETLDDVEHTARMIRTLPFSFVSVSIIVPYPGTKNYDIMKEAGLIETFDWSRYVMFGQRPQWRIFHLSAEDLLSQQKRLNRMFYLNPAYMVRQASKIRSLNELMYYVKAAGTFVSWLAKGEIAPKGLNEMDLDDSRFDATLRPLKAAE